MLRVKKKLLKSFKKYKKMGVGEIKREYHLNHPEWKKPDACNTRFIHPRQPLVWDMFSEEEKKERLSAKRKI